jgi:hypothetical protein
MSWTSDWKAFVASVCADWDAGLSDREVTDRHASRRIQWTGKVRNIDTLYEHHRLTVEMPDVSIRLRDGRIAIAEHIGLNVSPVHLEEWERLREGDIVRFEADIESDNPFLNSGIEWTDFHGQGYVTIAMRHARLVRVVQYGPADHSKPLPRPARRGSDDPLARLPEYRHCWDGSEPGWRLRVRPLMLVKFILEFDETMGPTDEQIGLLRSISALFNRDTDEQLREVIAKEPRLTIPDIREWTEEELEQIGEQLEEDGLRGEILADDSWSRLVPVGPDGTELALDDKLLSREVVQRMLDAGVPIEGGKRVTQWYFIGDYVRLE